MSTASARLPDPSISGHRATRLEALSVHVWKLLAAAVDGSNTHGGVLHGRRARRSPAKGARGQESLGRVGSGREQAMWGQGSPLELPILHRWWMTKPPLISWCRRSPDFSWMKRRRPPLDETAGRNQQQLSDLGHLARVFQWARWLDSGWTTSLRT
jgi:hypothetical protein